MKTVAVIQARLGSTRLPNKTVMNICGKPLIWHVVKRVMNSTLLDDVVLAVPEETNSEMISMAIHDLDVVTYVYHGDPNDLVRRYASTAATRGIDIIVRIPGDNPCVCGDEIDRMIADYHSQQRPVGWLHSNLDRNILNNGYPGGLGAEIYHRSFMDWMDASIHSPIEREHPHFWPMANGRVKTIECPEPIRRPELRFDVNTLGDLEYIRDIYDGIYHDKPDFNSKDIIDYLDNRRLS